MQKLWALQVLEIFQRGDERIQIVAVDGSDVIEAKFFEQGGRHHHAFGVFFKTLGQLEQRRRTIEHLFANFFGGRIKLATHELRQVPVERTHWRADRHVVVVQDDQQLGRGHACVIERLKGHACGHGAVADDSNRMALFAFLLRRHRHAQCRRNAGG